MTASWTESGKDTVFQSRTDRRSLSESYLRYRFGVTGGESPTTIGTLSFRAELQMMIMFHGPLLGENFPSCPLIL
jgi:hypothetical protein